MKKVFCITLMLILLLSMAACRTTPGIIVDESSDINSLTIPSASPSATSTPLLTEVNTPSANDKDIYDLEFSDLADLEFCFASGAGAWSTTVKIQPDGTFNGYYHDSDAGSGGTDYPYGTRYECYFSGNFTSLIKIDDYEYSIKCESLTIEGVVGQEEIINDVRVITSEPYGFDNANEFLLYLPGKQLNQLPEMFLGWVHINPESVDAESMDVLTFYGLYNVGGEQGFSAYEKE